MFDVETFKRTYPEFFGSNVTPEDIVRWLFIFIIPFLIAYLYIRFFESGVVSLFRDKVVPFIRFRLRLDKFIDFINRILKMQIFRNPGTRL